MAAGQLWSDGSRRGASCGYPHVPVFRQVLQLHQ
jgi:hypothetical protein